MSDAYQYQAWPKWLYDANGEGVLFGCEDDVPEGQWHESPADALAKLVVAAPAEPVVIPEGWADLHWKKQAALAKAISGEDAADAVGARAVIEAEIDRRAAE